MHLPSCSAFSIYTCASLWAALLGATVSPLHCPMTDLCGQAPDAMRSTASALQLLTVSLGKCVQALLTLSHIHIQWANCVMWITFWKLTFAAWLLISA